VDAKNPRPGVEVVGSNFVHIVGVAGFEPTASASRTQRAAKLRYTPKEAPEV
jgi:hypothetical protein